MSARFEARRSVGQLWKLDQMISDFASLILKKPVGLEKGVRFAIREGGKTVGAGLVTAVR